MVAWIENAAVKFKRFDGTAWVPATGGEGPASANANRVRLSSFSAFVGVADPVIAWTQGSGMARALKVAGGSGFTPLGTQVNAASLDPLTEFAVLAESGGGIVTWGDGESPFTVRSQRWNGNGWADIAGNNVVNNNPNRLLSIAMPRNETYVAYLWAPSAAGLNTLGVSNWGTFNNTNWQAIAPFFNQGVAGELLAPMPVEMATGASPIVVVVRRNALNQYVWQVLRYYP